MKLYICDFIDPSSNQLDSFIVEAEDEAEEVSILLKNEMENAVSLSVPMDVDVHSGKSWFEAK